MDNVIGQFYYLVVYTIDYYRTHSEATRNIILGDWTTTRLSGPAQFGLNRCGPKLDRELEMSKISYLDNVTHRKKKTPKIRILKTQIMEESFQIM